MNNTGKDILDLIWLTSCGVNESPIDLQRFMEVNEEAVHRLAVKHGIEQVIAFVMVSAWKACGDVKKAQAWESIIQRGMRRTLYFDIEREDILAHFENMGIWYMPLKGVVLKDMYPKQSMRQMTDNDILYDAEYRNAVLAFFEARGYRVERHEKSADDAAYKEPIFNFEMHKTLFNEFSDLYPYYADVRERLVSDEQSEFGLRFTDEDFYIYMIAHAAKHYRSSGHGLRFLLDMFIYLQRKRERMDWEYVEKELDKLNVIEYERTAKAVCLKLFSIGQFSQDTCFSPDEEELLDVVLQSTLFGTTEEYVQQHLKAIQKNGNTSRNKAKLIYVFQRLFPNMNEMVFRYPELENRPWMLPLYHLKRITSAMALSFDRYAQEFIKTIKSEK